MNKPYAAWISMGAILFTAALFRLAVSELDPPGWTFLISFYDSGWWAASARGKVLFGDYFADDFGMAYLIVPLYTFLLRWVFEAWDAGVPQLRAFCMMCDVAAIAVTAAAVWRGAGRRAALIAAALLSLSPFYWTQGHTALPESLQIVFLAGAFGCWFVPFRRTAALFASGLMLAAAIAVKPSAVTLGVFPILAAGAAATLIELRNQEGWTAGGTVKALAVRFTPLFLGLGAGLAALYAIVIRPNWDLYTTLFLSEAQNELRWKMLVFTPGLSFVSRTFTMGNPPEYIVWRLANWSPAIFAGAWLFVLLVLLEARRGFRAALDRFGAFEWAAMAWSGSLMALLLTSPDPNDYRQVLLMPSIAMLAAVFVDRFMNREAKEEGSDDGGESGRIYSILLWAWLLFPALVILKPFAASLAAPVFDQIGALRAKGLANEAALTAATMVWIAAVVALGWKRFDSRPFAASLARRAAPLLLAAFFLFEVHVSLDYLMNGKTTFKESLAQLEGVVPEGAEVAGKHTATWFMNQPVRVVRRSDPSENPNHIDIPSLDRAERPDYFLLPQIFNYAESPVFKDILDLGPSRTAESVSTFNLGPMEDGLPRIHYVLFKMSGAPAGAAISAGAP